MQYLISRSFEKDKKVTAKATPSAPVVKEEEGVIADDVFPVAVENETKAIAVQEQSVVTAVTSSTVKPSSLKNRMAMKMAEKVLQNTPAQAFVEQAKTAEVKAAPSYSATTTAPAHTGGDVPVWLLYVLAIVIPPVAVGLVTDWETKPLIISIILTILCGIPGIIHALIVVSKNK